MPIVRRAESDPALIVILLLGRVTDDELLAYYIPLIPAHDYLPWRELVDGTQVTDLAVTTQGLDRLAALVARSIEKVRGGRLAMVAATPVVYGVFRMWELRREDLDYEVRVFRDLEPALAWLLLDVVPA